MNEHEKVIASGDAETVKRESARRTRRSFVVGGAAAAAGYGVLHWINNSPMVDRLEKPLRKTLDVDAAINRDVWGFRGMAPEYPMSKAVPLRLNGVIGLDQPLIEDTWRLQMAGVAKAQSFPQYVKDVTAWQYGYQESTAPNAFAPPDLKSAPKPADAAKGGAPGDDGLSKTGRDLKDAPKVNGIPHISITERFEAMAQAETGKRYQGSAEAGPSASALNIGTPGLLLSMDELRELPKVEFVTEFKCIEGWSEITHWGGVRLRDLIDAYPPEKINGRDPRYVYMETPDGDFYCGYDMAAARHPQSLLVMEMGGEPLTVDHGAPLRLHMPIKYGYKQIKRIGLIAYMDTKPDDYWTKLGYDWYAGI
jgi:hypothetical protein